MDEARAVLNRLRRIQLLEEEGADPRHLLAEVRCLLDEVEGWLAVEAPGTERACEALARCEGALGAGRRVPVHAR